MTKKMSAIVLFAGSFVVTYVLLCFAFPGAKMAAEATWFDYLRVAITYMALFKITISLIAAFGVGAVSRLIEKKKR